MALMLSPPPEISSLQEPEPSSDEDLVPNDPATFESPQPRKRKRTKQTATPSKRPKVTTEKTVPSPSRQPNAVAGPSKPRVPHRRSKSPSTRVPASSNGVAPRRSQASSNGQVKKASVSHPRTQSAASASTKPVRRTVKEKRRQRDSDSDSDPSTFKSQANNGAPSVSAPVPKRRDSQAFQRTALAKRFTTKSESAPVRPRKNVIVIDLCDSSEEEQPASPRPVKPATKSDKIIDVTDSDSESTIRKKSAARKAQKQNGIKTAPPANGDLIEIFDSDEEPARPAKPAITKVEDIGASSHQMPNGSSKLPSPDPMNLDPNDGIDFGGDDIAMRNDSPGLGLPEDLNSVHPPASSPVENGAAYRDLPDRRSKFTMGSLSVNEAQRLALLEIDSTSNARPGDGASEQQFPLRGGFDADEPAATPRHDQYSTSELDGVDAGGFDAAPGDRSPRSSTAKRKSPAVAPFPPSLQDEANIPDLNGVVRSDARGLSLNSLEPTGSSAEKPSSRTSPLPPPPLQDQDSTLDLNGVAQLDVPSTQPANSSMAKRAVSPPPSSPPPLFRLNSFPASQAQDTVPPPANTKPPSKPSSLRKAPRSSLPIAKDGSTSSSPYKGMRDRALETSAATLQQNMGQLPRLDLRTLPKKRPLPPRAVTPPPQASEPPERQEQGARSLEGFSFPASPSPVSPQKKPQSPVPKLLPWKQRSLVEAIITTGQHNVQSGSALSQLALPLPRPPPSPRLPLPPRPPPSPHPPTSPPSSRPPPSPPSPLAPRPPSVPRVDEGPPLTPPLKVEEAPAGPSTSLVNDIIDLTLSSDDEADLPPPAPPLPYVGESGKLKTYMSRIANFLNSSRRPSSADPADALSTRRPESPYAADRPHDAMDVDRDLAPPLDEVPRQNEMDRPTVPDRSPPSTPSPPVEGAKMEIDGEDGTPTQSEQPLVPETLHAISAPLTGVGANLPEVSHETHGNVTDRGTTPASPPQPDTGQERRSYDDTEVYYLEYIGPPTTYASESEVEDLVAPRSATDDLPIRGDVVPEIKDVTASISATDGPSVQEDMNAESDEVQDLVTPNSSTDDSPAPRNMEVESEHASDDDSAFSVSGPALFRKPVLEASDDDENSASPKPALRRSSRRSSASYSEADPLDLFDDEYEESFDLSTPGSPRSTTDVGMRAIVPPSIESANENLFPVITWDSYRRDLSNFQFPVYYAKDLVSLLHDYINASDEYFRTSPNMRNVFESTIRENTAEDDPDAPWIDVINDIDDEPTPPWEFYYTNKMWLGEGINPPDITQLVGCDCKGKCDPRSTTCACLLRQKPYLEGVYTAGFAYDNKGRLRAPGAPIFECNALCSCDDDECKNRVVQHGRKCSVSIKKTKNKGWGVFASKKILKGTFIGLYSGEFLRDDISERRGIVYDKSGRTYLLDIDFYYMGETKYVVDAYHAGNFTRFLNNSCDPNCKVNPCYINEGDIEKPLLTLFAKRDIAIGEELCFSYQGYDPDTADPEDKNKAAANSIVNLCRCEAPTCTGFMFG